MNSYARRHIDGIHPEASFLRPHPEFDYDGVSVFETAYEFLRRIEYGAPCTSYRMRALEPPGKEFVFVPPMPEFIIGRINVHDGSFTDPASFIECTVNFDLSHANNLVAANH